MSNVLKKLKVKSRIYYVKIVNFLKAYFIKVMGN